MNIQNLTLEQKIGQMFLVSFEGTHITNEHIAHFEKCKIGNFIYFARNLTQYQNIRNLSDTLQEIAHKNAGIPAFISTDQEGGMVARAYSGATHFPSNMAITAAGTTVEDIQAMGHMVATELKALGINLNHAPVVDVNNNPKNPVIGVRSYSDKPEVVAKMANAYIAGLQGGGVLANAKHFPGHGDTDKDSHLALPMVNHDLQRLSEVELAPFVSAIENGLDSIMSAHIIFKQIDPDNPATLSHKVLGQMLRQQLKFEGLILTDSMSMDAIRTFYTMEKGCVMAINAGVDLLCMCDYIPGQQACYEAVLNAVKTGEIPMATIDAAVSRIIKYKEKYAKPIPTQPQEVYPPHEALAESMSQKSITLVHDKGNLLPLKDLNDTFVISPPVVRANIADDTIVELAPFGKGSPHFAEIAIDPTPEAIRAIITQAASHPKVLLASYNAMQYPGQIALFKALKAAGKKVILVSLRVPYDILHMPGADAYVAAYEYTNRSVKNTLQAILGTMPFTGQLPIKLC